MGLDFGKLVKNVVSSDAGKKVVSKATKAATKAVTKTETKASKGLDMSSLISLATKNTDVISALGKLGALKETVEPEADKAQKIVKQVFSLVKKTVKVPIDEATFTKIVTKLISSDVVKKKIEKLSGVTGSLPFIKKAISAFAG